MPFSLGITEMIFLFAILLLVFGAKRLPEIGSAMGKSIRDFKRTINGLDATDSLPERSAEDRIPGEDTRAKAPAEKEAEPRGLRTE